LHTLHHQRIICLTQLQPGDAPPMPLWGGPNVLDDRKLDLWTRASSNSQLWDLQLRTTADNELVGP
jgi:hypothetical protein